MKTPIALLCAAALGIGCATTDVSESNVEAVAKTLDYGDSSSQTLTTKAWEALADKNYPAVLAYTSRTIELYGEEGKKMNAEMTAFEPSTTAHDKWALNDVGTSLFIMAQAYVDLEMYREASETYQTLAEDYRYAQCWDPKGWFWRPADGAAEKAEKYALRD